MVVFDACCNGHGFISTAWFSFFVLSNRDLSHSGSAPKLPKGSQLKVPYMGRLGRCYTEGRPRQGEPFKTIEGDQLAKQLDE
jgi:hypothetical protein